MTSRSVLVQMDRPRHLSFSFNALADMIDMDPQILRRPISHISALRVYLWAGLKDEDPQITPARVGEIVEEFLIAGGDLEEIIKAVGDAMMVSAFQTRKRKPVPQQIKQEGAAALVPRADDPHPNSGDTGSKPSSQPPTGAG